MDDCDLITIGGDFSDLDDGLTEEEIINNLKKPITPAFFGKVDQKSMTTDEFAENKTCENPTKPDSVISVKPTKGLDVNKKGRRNFQSRFSEGDSLTSRNFRNQFKNNRFGNQYGSSCNYRIPDFNNTTSNGHYRQPTPLFNPPLRPLMNSTFLFSPTYLAGLNNLNQNRPSFKPLKTKPYRLPFSNKPSTMLSLPNNSLSLTTPNVPSFSITPLGSSHINLSNTTSSFTSSSSFIPNNTSFSANSSSNPLFIQSSYDSDILRRPFNSSTHVTPLIHGLSQPPALMDTSFLSIPPIVNKNKTCPKRTQPYRRSSRIFSKLSSPNTSSKVLTTTTNAPPYSTSSDLINTFNVACTDSAATLTTPPSFVSNSLASVRDDDNSSSIVLNQPPLCNSGVVGKPLTSSTPEPQLKKATNDNLLPEIDDLILKPIEILSPIKDQRLLSPLKTPPPPPQIGTADFHSVENEKNGRCSVILRLGNYVSSPTKENNEDTNISKDLVNRRLFDAAEEDLPLEDDHLGCDVLLNDLEMSEDEDDIEDNDLLQPQNSSKSKPVNNHDDDDDDALGLLNSSHVEPNDVDHILAALHSEFTPPVHDDHYKLPQIAFPTIFKIANFSDGTKTESDTSANQESIWLNRVEYDKTSVDCQVIVSNLSKETTLCDLLTLCQGICDPWAVAKFNETCARISFRTPLTANIFIIKNQNAKLNGSIIKIHKSIIEID